MNDCGYIIQHGYVSFLDRKLSVGKEAWEVIQSVCPTPSMKFLTPLHSWSTKVSTSWDQLMHHFANSSLTRRFSLNNETVFPATSSLLLTTRSSPHSMAELERSLKSLEAKLVNCCNPVAWNLFPFDIRMSCEPWLNDRKYLTICANNSSIIDYLNTVCTKARMMHSEGAYLHWFTRHGCERNWFEEAFELMDQTISCYLDHSKT